MSKKHYCRPPISWTKFASDDGVVWGDKVPLVGEDWCCPTCGKRYTWVVRYIASYSWEEEKKTTLR